MDYGFLCNKASTFSAFQVFLEIPESPSNPAPPLPTPLTTGVGRYFSAQQVFIINYRYLSPNNGNTIFFVIAFVYAMSFYFVFEKRISQSVRIVYLSETRIAINNSSTIA